MSGVLGVIPVRMDSSRFPGKPLAMLHGRSMIEHVHRGTARCPLLDEVAIATCDAEIAPIAEASGARAVMTSPAHERASTRVAEASAGDPADIVAMVQGDEPMVRPDTVAIVIESLQRNAKLQCVNLASPTLSESDLPDPNTIELETDHAEDALYFSRQSIPHSGGRPFVPGGLAGAALDVFEHEPLPDSSPLRAMTNVYLAPHNSNSSPVAAERVHVNTIRQVIQALATLQP